jgi:predicted ATPase/DNA-binding XRE family transcriptional regulator
VGDSFGDLLRRCRRNSGLSQAALAESAGLSTNAISALERGQRTRPYPHTVRVLADTMQLSEADRHALVAAAAGTSVLPERHHLAAPTVPTPLTSFVGRDWLIAFGLEIMTRERFVTLTGLAGIGKTRLATELSRRTAARFGDGRWTVDVESMVDATLTDLVAAVLGVPDAAEPDRLGSVARWIGDLRCLLILDGCEHRTTECADVARRLLAACPGLVVLATSQRPLAVQGEVILAVPPLVIPVAGDAGATETEAVQLFLARAQLAFPEVVLRPDELGAVCELCRQLDGIPLAIELAAARVRALPVAEMLDRMQSRFDLLSGYSDAPARKRAIRAALEWNCGLLSPEERALFARLSVFVGRFSLRAVEGGPGRDLPAVLDHMTALIDASLVSTDAPHGPTARFRLLDTVRLYAGELLRQAQEEDAARCAHAHYYLELAELCEPEIRGPDQASVLRLLDEEYENLRAALHYWAESAESASLLRLVTALAPYWVRRGRTHDGQHWVSHVLSANPPNAIPLRTFEAASDLRWVAGNVAEHREAAQRYLDQATLAGDLVHSARATLYLSSTYLGEGDTDAWQVLVSQARKLAEDASDAWTLAIVLNDTGSGLTIRDAITGGDEGTTAALPMLREALDRARSTGDVNLVALVLDSLAYAETRRGLSDEARTHWSACLLDFGDVIDPGMAATCLEGLAVLAHRDARHADCLTLLAVSAAHRRRHNTSAPPVWVNVMAATAAAARAALPADASAAADVAGKQLAFAEAVHLALPGPTHTPTAPPGVDPG